MCRSFSFTLTYDPTLLHISAAALASGLPADWSATVTNTAGSLVVTASGTTQLTGTNLPVVVITADVPTTAPYGALEALRLTNPIGERAIGCQRRSRPRSPATYAVHKNLYLGDADGSGIYTGNDAGADQPRGRRHR